MRFACDRNHYRRVIWESLARFPVEIFSYCLTSNHTHFLVRAADEDLISRWMQQVEGEFAQWYNRRKKRSGGMGRLSGKL